MFGNKTPFGTTSTFGTSTFGTTASPFGQSTSTFTGNKTLGGSFTTQPFGASSAGSSLFGTATSTPSLFGGTTSTFGQNAAPANSSFVFGGTPTPSTGIFGGTAQQAAGSGLFATPGTSAFGTPKTTFGNAGFGNTASSTLFGQNQQQSSSIFSQGSTAGSGLFGATSAFGTSTVGATGTTVKFNAVAGSDTMMKNGVSTNIATRHQCITVMKEYENKSLEELRVEDYLANRKGVQQTALGVFGSTPSQSAGLFSSGTTTTTGFFNQQDQNKALFGGGTAFSTAQPTTTGLFGHQPQQQMGSPFAKTLPFGTTATTQSSNIFGTPAFAGVTQPNKSLFGPSNLQQTGMSVFGTAAPAQPTTSFATGTSFGTGFGTPASTIGLFGPKTTGFVSATTSTPTFGSASGTNVGTSLFNPKPPGTATFGTGSTGFVGFGTAANTTGNIFSQTKPNVGFTSLNPSFGGGMNSGGFGSNIFGTQTTQPGSLGMSTGLGMNNALGFGMGSGLGTGNFSGFNAGLGSDANAAQQQAQAHQQMLLLASSPFGDSPLFRNMLQDTGKREELLKPQTKKLIGTTAQLKVSPAVTGRVKLTSLRVPQSAKSSLFDDLEDGDGEAAKETLVLRPNVKRLVLKPRSRQESTGPSDSPDAPPMLLFSPRTPTNQVRDAATSTTQEANEDADSCDLIRGRNNFVTTPSEPGCNDTVVALNVRRFERELRAADDEGDGSLLEESSILEEERDASHKDPHPAGVMLKRDGYYTIPSMDEIGNMLDEDGTCYVENFTVGREDYGNVCFPGLTDVAGINLDEIVHFRRKEVTLYPDDDQKPPIGQELNKKAQITLDRVWPHDKTTHYPIRDPERLKTMNYQERLENVAAKLGARFVEYRPETGSWVFQVNHFSKYGLEESDEDDPPGTLDQSVVNIPVPPVQKQTDLVKKPPIISEMLSSNETNGRMRLTLNENGEGESVPLRLRDDDDDMEDVDETNADRSWWMRRDKINEDLAEDGEEEMTWQSPRPTGMDCKRLQAMKATFTMMDEEGDQDYRPAPAIHIDRLRDLRGEVRNDPRSSPARMTAAANVSFPTEPNKRIKFFDFPETRGRVQPVKDILADLPTNSVSLCGAEKDQLLRMQPVALPKECNGLLPLPRSFVANKQRLIADAACFAGRSFRAGWGPGQTMAHLGEVLGKHGMDHVAAVDPPSFSSVTVERVAPLITSERDVTWMKNAKETLGLELSETRLAVEDGCPLAVPNPGVESLPSFHRLSEKQRHAATEEDAGYLKQCHTVWGLLTALWGKLDNDGDDAYEVHMGRRRTFSDWLAATSRDTVDAEVARFMRQDDGYLSMIFSHLSGHRVSEAVAVARDALDLRMELLLAQGGSNVVVRKSICQQLCQWRDTRSDGYIAVNRLKIYALLAGIPFWHTSEESVNACQDLDWKRALAVHLWYGCAPMVSVEGAFQTYREAMKGSVYGCYAAQPSPPYAQSLSFGPSEDRDEECPAHVARDTCYHLLKLYCCKSHRLDRLLTPTASTPDNLDYRLSWHVWQALCRIGYAHLSEQNANALHCGYAAQLENAGLWTWAIFVFLHISHSAKRKCLAMEVIARNISTKSDGRPEIFLQQKLLVPAEWIYEAKALRARHSGDVHEEAWCLLKAGHWNASHSLVIRHIAPDAIVNENYDYLKGFLEELGRPDRVLTIADWATGGQVFLDYIHLSQTVDRIKEGELNACELERLQPEVTSLCKRIKSVTCRNTKDRLCVSEIAKKSANLLKVVVSLQTVGPNAPYGDAPLPTRILASHISDLPLPEDYRMQELQALSCSYTTESIQ